LSAGRPAVSTDAALSVPVAATKNPFSLEVRVWRDRRYVTLLDAIPLGGGAQVRITAVAPPGMYSALVSRGSGGMVEPLVLERRPAGAGVDLSFPSKDSQASRVEGPKGNELILLCASRALPVDISQVRQLLVSVSAWPMLPPDSVLAIDADGSRALQHSRDLGAPADRPDPEEEVLRSLNELARQLRTHFDHFEGLAFYHGE
jgi:hypothetical protein